MKEIYIWQDGKLVSTYEWKYVRDLVPGDIFKNDNGFEEITSKRKEDGMTVIGTKPLEV